MVDVVERTQVAAPLGRVWQIVTDVRSQPEREGARARQLRVDERREVAWKSTLAVDGDLHDDIEVEVEWWFRLDPSWQGTQLEHGCRAPDDVSRDALRGTVRAVIVATLAEVKARAERS